MPMMLLDALPPRAVANMMLFGELSASRARGRQGRGTGRCRRELSILSAATARCRYFDTPTRYHSPRDSVNTIAATICCYLDDTPIDVDRHYIKAAAQGELSSFCDIHCRDSHTGGTPSDAVTLRPPSGFAGKALVLMLFFLASITLADIHLPLPHGRLHFGASGSYRRAYGALSAISDKAADFCRACVADEASGQLRPVFDEMPGHISLPRNSATFSHFLDRRLSRKRHAVALCARVLAIKIRHFYGHIIFSAAIRDAIFRRDMMRCFQPDARQCLLDTRLIPAHIQGDAPSEVRDFRYGASPLTSYYAHILPPP